MENYIYVNSFQELYTWFKENNGTFKYIWVKAKRGKPDVQNFNYLDAVYCALCFGWIDSTLKNVNGITYQKLMPRSSKSHWTYLNVARCKYLIDKGLMTKKGLEKVPLEYDPLTEYNYLLEYLKKDVKIWENFSKFPELYKKIRIDNLHASTLNPELFQKRLDKLLSSSKHNKMYGIWNDYGRLK